MVQNLQPINTFLTLQMIQYRKTELAKAVPKTNRWPGAGAVTVGHAGLVDAPNLPVEIESHLCYRVIKRGFCRSFNNMTVREQHPRSRSHHKGATDHDAAANATGGKPEGRVRTGDPRHPVLCFCQLGQDIPISD